MKKFVTYLIAGAAGLVLAAMPVQAKDSTKRQLAKGRSKVQVATVIVSAPAPISDADSFRNDHPEGGN